ncbi:MAG: Gfo/Idh/MocA family oxidoreductase, partial [Planctomycetales bacterium]|nr:Gfo/Idh/MocA family oxidoreductase [Planctomycetales bacterium]
MSTPSNRRTFLQNSTTAAAGVALAGSMINSAHAAGSDEIRFALVGCGGRGTGAAEQIMNTKGNVKLVAVADAFENKVAGAVNGLKRKDESKVDVPPERMFTGLDAYKKAIDVDCDLVIIATPPGFKPQQLEYAVNKGRHIFMEKPVAVDAPGVRRVLQATEEAKKKNLMLAVGLQRRHEPQYMETIQRIHDGAIGDVICQRVYWNGGGIWYRNRTSDQSEMAFQVNNWYHFIWICGDQICEQHIHNLDVGCWVKGEYPVECNGMGGGEQRMGGDRTKTQIFDHTFCEFTFADGTKMFSQGRHLGNKAWSYVGEAVHGTKGTADPSGYIRAEKEWRFPRRDAKGGHQQEQHDLIEALMAGRIYNEGEYGAKSTFTS